MTTVLSIWLEIFLSLFFQFNSSLENAFLRNDAAQLGSLLNFSSPAMISLVEPLNFSDCFTPAQVRVVLDRIFNQVITQEFFVDPPVPLISNGQGAIISARWSFISRVNRKKYIFRLYFFISPERVSPGSKLRMAIKEIRAERL